MLQQNNQKQFDTIKEVDFRNRVSQKTESIVPSCKNTWDKFVEEDNVWKPKQALERKTHYREAHQSVTDLICKLLNQQNAPELDIETFDGDPMQFHYFMGIFHEIAERKVDDAQGRLTRLIKFTKDEAKEMVKTFIQLPRVVGVKTAKRLLHERYGDPHKITTVYRNQIKKWPHIKAGDSDAYKITKFLIKCENIDQAQGWNVLNTRDVICMLVSKLPGSGRDRWSRKVLKIRRKHRRWPDKMDLIQFVNDETVIVTDPILLKEAVEQYVEKRPNNRKEKLSAFVTGKEERSENCCYCDEQHKLDKCDKFMEVILKERIKFLAKKKYFYGCFQPRTDPHNSKTCTRRLICSSWVHPKSNEGQVRW